VSVFPQTSIATKAHEAGISEFYGTPQSASPSQGKNDLVGIYGDLGDKSRIGLRIWLRFGVFWPGFWKGGTGEHVRMLPGSTLPETRAALPHDPRYGRARRPG